MHPERHNHDDPPLHPCSMAAAVPAVAAVVRAGWRIGNIPPCALDVAFDKGRARHRRDHGQDHLAILRKLALDMLRTGKIRYPRPTEAKALRRGPRHSHEPCLGKCDKPAA